MSLLRSSELEALVPCSLARQNRGPRRLRSRRRSESHATSGAARQSGEPATDQPPRKTNCSAESELSRRRAVLARVRPSRAFRRCRREEKLALPAQKLGLGAEKRFPSFPGLSPCDVTNTCSHGGCSSASLPELYTWRLASKSRFRDAQLRYDLYMPKQVPRVSRGVGEAANATKGAP